MIRRRMIFGAIAAMFLALDVDDAAAQRRRRRRRAGAARSARSGAAGRSSGGARGFSGDGPYRNCSEARAAGAAPMRVGDEGYSTRLDRDRDGVACE
ncbi:excalibur calcium-binding domain-containing protein [Sphingomonas sp. IW22]|uniref:excalibur calcium-binding domain-containing protein n=1 Tax=Sphingomonas sp. IW22 TaxID=3242489 RepID=UPI003522B208